jgi:hypothetical protein
MYAVNINVHSHLHPSHRGAVTAPWPGRIDMKDIPVRLCVYVAMIG